MTNEQKQLLIIDLCGRLPYGVKVKSKNGEIATLVNPPTVIQDDCWDFKPYLRPMDSMTVEEWVEWCDCCSTDESERVFTKIKNDEYMFVFPTNKMKFLYSHHFDFLGLIPKGLAIAVTEENNPYKN